MTDKQMIIDGCEFQSDCIEYKDISYLTSMPICAIYELSIACYDKVNKCKYYKLYKQLKRKEQECEELTNKLNSNIERMNAQNEKLHNENKELKSYIKEDLVPHTQIYVGLINRIKQQMKTILMVSTNGKYRPVKNSTKEQCYQILGNIQELLKTNIITINRKEQ